MRLEMKREMINRLKKCLLAAAVAGATPSLASEPVSTATAAGYGGLVELFRDWREFEHPGLLEGAPDYTEANMQRMHRELRGFLERLRSFEISGWTREQQADWHLVRAEMNGMDFNISVLRPWQRDPAFYASVWNYQSDTPAHEGPNHHALVELWTYEFPLTEGAEAKLVEDLRGIPPLLTQARRNLTGNARDLWVAGIKKIDDQAAELETLSSRIPGAGSGLQAAVREALEETVAFSAWLQERASSKTGPSGVGKENYTWHLQNVHLVPMTWEEEVSLLKRELDRAHAGLRLEEHHNRNLPLIRPIASAEEYERRAEQALVRFTAFLREERILPPYEYIEPALRAHMGAFVPEASRNFFWTVAHHEQLALWTHWYHWFDLARMSAIPHTSPVRRGPLLYNIWDSRSEGMATGFEEMMMHAGLFDDNPRARELVYIMLAQRAARGLGSLYAQANEFTMKEARDFHVDWTPRGWMREDLDLLGFEQHLYLRQPGYGTSYVTGKYLIERLLAERSKQEGEGYGLLEFFTELDGVGLIPVSLIRYQLTGNDDELSRMMASGD
jgi:hypothetical protein